ncbi:cell death regulator Aven-like [Montipora foliosa]|uniref:cell death regulator Aven-like n=1 Tax=Montipora foliosa TaxID=591990 RepID=UPI0035F192B4
MRPDEHKKKNRAEYKKKHGIPSKKAPPMEGKENFKEDYAAQDVEKVVSPETEEAEQVQFSRRKIQSNWDRYEEITEFSEEEDVSLSVKQRGEDYNVLLQRSANPASEFRFHSEKDWDQESHLSTSQDTASALNVDFAALATSLNSVPLHKRLNISADYLHLPPDLVLEFEERAKLYRPDQPCLTPTNERHIIGKPEVRPGNVSSPQINKHEERGFIKRSQEQFGSNTKELRNSQRSNKEVLKANPIRNGVQHSQVKPKSVEKIKTSLKDVCNAVTISPSTNGTAGKGLESVIVGNQDDELEFLLSLESAEPTRDNITATHTVSVNTSEVKPPLDFPSSSLKPRNNDNDLEDWLDSILD